MMIFGASEVSRNVDFGDETTTMMCKFVLRASEASILNEMSADLQEWLDDRIHARKGSKSSSCGEIKTVNGANSDSKSSPATPTTSQRRRG